MYCFIVLNLSSNFTPNQEFVKVTDPSKIPVTRKTTRIYSNITFIILLLKLQSQRLLFL